jgi:hypothetical protein
VGSCSITAPPPSRLHQPDSEPLAPSPAFDGRYLLLAAQNVVDVRDPATHALVQTIDLGSLARYAAPALNLLRASRA